MVSRGTLRAVPKSRKCAPKSRTRPLRKVSLGNFPQIHRWLLVLYICNNQRLTTASVCRRSGCDNTGLSLYFCCYDTETGVDDGKGANAI